MSDIQKIKDEIDKLTLEQLPIIKNYLQNHLDKLKKQEDMFCDKSVLKVNYIHKISGIGIVLDLETITPGFVKLGYVYKCGKKGTVIIKSFENNFCPQEFQHPSRNILAHIKLGSDLELKDLYIDMLLEPI